MQPGQERMVPRARSTSRFAAVLSSAPGGFVAPRRLGIVRVRVEQDIRGAHGLERAQIGAHLLEVALAGDALGIGQGAVGQMELDPRAERGHRPVFLGSDLPELRQCPYRAASRCGPDRMPRVAVEHRATDRAPRSRRRPRWADAALATWPGRRVHVGEADEAPFVGGDVLRPAGLDRAQVVVGHGAALLERQAERLEFLLRPADADAEDEPPAAELVHHRRRARRLERVAVRHDDDRGAELDPARDAREPARARSGARRRARGSGSRRPA